MSQMLKIISDISKKKTDKVNPLVFNRTHDKPIHEYMMDGGFAQAEVLPFIKIIGHELITDASEIDIKLNRRYLKNKAIQKDKSITKVISTKESAFNLLVVKIEINYKGDTRYVTVRLLIPAYIDDRHLLIDGNKILVINQLVDTSTYTAKGSLKLKTALTPIDVYKSKVKKKDIMKTTMGEEFRIKSFVLNIFTKELNPLYYYVAKMGVSKTINYFNLGMIVSPVEEIYDEDLYYYFKISKKLYIEVRKDYFEYSQYVRMFTKMIHSLFPSRSGMEVVDDLMYWKKKLGAQFTSNPKTQISKATQVGISFSRILDKNTAETMRINEYHLQSTYSLIRWMLQNFGQLRKKDNYDLANKRVRSNELIAASFNMNFSRKINSLLNRKKLEIESIEKIFNFREDELMSTLIYGKHPCAILRYGVDINSNTAINACRYTTLGLSGLSGGHATPLAARAIHPSHIGRLDLNCVSHGSNTALTGMLTPYAKIDEHGHFADTLTDPDNFIDDFAKLHKELKKKAKKKDLQKMVEYENKKLLVRHRYDRMRKLNSERNERGNIVIPKRGGKKVVNPHTKRFLISRNGEPNRYKDAVGREVNVDGRFKVSSRVSTLITNDKGRYVIPPRVSFLDGPTKIPKSVIGEKDD